jgi:hypothetical protein
MNNKKFHWLIREPRDARGKPLWTVAKIAQAIYCNRCRVTDALNNKAGHGAQTRPKLARFFKEKFPNTWEQILESLGWDKDGKIPTTNPQRVA